MLDVNEMKNTMGEIKCGMETVKNEFVSWIGVNCTDVESKVIWKTKANLRNIEKKHKYPNYMDILKRKSRKEELVQ